MTGTAGDERRLTRDPRLWRVIIAASIGVFAIELDFFAVQAALPDMARDLGTSVTTLQWVISGYMLANGATLIVGGRVGDLLGRRRWPRPWPTSRERQSRASSTTPRPARLARLCPETSRSMCGNAARMPRVAGS